jgi:cytoskeletal protein CcmA (bactofilin family)
MYLKKLIFTLPALLALTLHADGMIQTDEYQIATNQTVTAETWVMCNTAAAQGTFEDDLFIGAITQIALNGTYKENVWVGSLSAKVTMNGTCERNVRLVGKDVSIDGTIEGNLIVWAFNSIVIGTNAVIKGSVQLHSGVNSIICEGSIGGPATFESLKSVTINGPVFGDVEITSPDIVLPKNAHIAGNLTYLSNRDLFPPEGVVAGKLTRLKTPSPYSLDRLKVHAISFIAAFFVGLPFLSLFPTTTALGTLLIRKSPFKCLLVGFIAFFALPFLGMIGIVSAYGLPLGALLFVSWGVLIYISRIIAGLIIGTVILRSGNTTAGRLLLSLAAGLVVIYVLFFLLPGVGMALQMVIIWMGSGALLLTISQRRQMVAQFSNQINSNNKDNTTEEL